MEPRIKKVVDYIHKYTGSKLTNDCLAQQINMTTNSFTRFFRNYLKCSPQEYVRETRVSMACNLLDHSIYTIDEIAERCGFLTGFIFESFKKSKNFSG
ncbi:MAG: helix-turn-helix domain-containing protein [Chloroflexia bacterium]|nr:helix-turn-helix domain-containing protein [Chloroflexia bacterium]